MFEASHQQIMSSCTQKTNIKTVITEKNWKLSRVWQVTSCYSSATPSMGGLLHRWCLDLNKHRYEKHEKKENENWIYCHIFYSYSNGCNWVWAWCGLSKWVEVWIPLNPLSIIRSRLYPAWSNFYNPHRAKHLFLHISTIQTAQFCWAS